MSATNTGPSVSVAPANAAQLAAWDGDEGAYWATHAATFDRSIAPYHGRLMAAAAIEPQERVLDIGCGTGETTRDAARAASAGSALGVDLSSRMLEYARRRAADEGVTNAEFAQLDAQIHAFDPGSFDVAISRMSVMFFGDLAAGLANVGRALRAGGRVALLTWQPRAANEWISAFTAALAAGRDMSGPPPNTGPFALSEPDRIRALFDAAGFTAIELDSVSERMWFGADGSAAYEFIIGLMQWMLDGLDDVGRERARAGLRNVMDEHETADGVMFGSGAWIIRASRP